MASSFRSGLRKGYARIQIGSHHLSETICHRPCSSLKGVSYLHEKAVNANRIWSQQTLWKALCERYSHYGRRCAWLVGVWYDKRGNTLWFYGVVTSRYSSLFSLCCWAGGFISGSFVKLLLDQNLSPRLERLLSTQGIECFQVRSLALENATDISIWQHAKVNNFTIVTSDSDFSDLAILRGVPPRIVLLRYGNTSTGGHFNKLQQYLQQIEAFSASEDVAERVFIIRWSDSLLERVNLNIYEKRP